MEEPFTDLDINAKAQLSILEACRKHNPEIRIILQAPVKFMENQSIFLWMKTSLPSG